MINVGYVNTECFPEMSQAKLLCSTSDNALLWGLETAPCLCRNVKCASNKKEIFLLLRPAFHVLSLAKAFPCALASLAVSRVTASLWNFHQQLTEPWRGQEAALPPLIHTQTRVRNPSHPCEALGPDLPPSLSFLLFFFLAPAPTALADLGASLLPCSFLSPVLGFFVARPFLSVMPLTFTRAPALYLFVRLTIRFMMPALFPTPASSWLFFKILMA